MQHKPTSTSYYLALIAAIVSFLGLTVMIGVAMYESMIMGGANAPYLVIASVFALVMLAYTFGFLARRSPIIAPVEENNVYKHLQQENERLKTSSSSMQQL